MAENLKFRYKLDFNRKRYGASKWQLEEFDCIDLYMELLVLLNCKILDICRPCRHFLVWFIQILNCKWDTIRYIELEDAFKKATYLKEYLPEYILQRHFNENRKIIKKIIEDFRKGNNSKNVLHKYKKIFLEGNKKHSSFRDFILKKYIQ